MFYYSIYHPPSSFLWTIINIQFKKQNHSNLFFLLNENIFFILESCNLFILCYCKEYSYNINPRSNIILYFIYTDLKKKTIARLFIKCICVTRCLYPNAVDFICADFYDSVKKTPCRHSSTLYHHLIINVYVYDLCQAILKVSYEMYIVYLP